MFLYLFVLSIYSVVSVFVCVVFTACFCICLCCEYLQRVSVFVCVVSICSMFLYLFVL